MRHAKSSWAIPGARDFDRELNERGIYDLDKIRQLIKARDYIPEQILCSPSTRTRQTLDGISAVLPPETNVQYSDRLYSSGLSEYIELIHDVSHTGSLMIIGHNPMCGALAASLPKPDSTYPVDEIAYRYPTATIAVIDFDEKNWSEIKKTHGNLIDCILPSAI